MKKLAHRRGWWHHITNTLATPLLGKPSDAPIWRVFFFLKRFPVFQRLKYKKPPLTHEEQLQLLESRGLVVTDRALALRWLSRVSYYRFSAYLYPYRVFGTDNYRAGTTFSEIAYVYNFDRQLRMLLMDAIERAEIWIRTAITYEMAHHCGAFGHLNKSLFKRGFHGRHRTILLTLREEQVRSKETFVEHYFDKYRGENDLPIWMATELLTFGVLSTLFSGLPVDMKRTIARQIDLKDSVLSSWLQSMSYIRNLCAHHSRVWNRTLAVAPKIMKRSPYGEIEPQKIYAGLVTLQHVLSRTAPHSTWAARVVRLIKDNPRVDIAQMGFPSDWDTREPFRSAASGAGRTSATPFP